MSGPPPPIYRGTATPFDVAAASAAFTRAQEALRPGEHVAMTVQLNRDGFGGGIVARGPFKSELLATLTRPTGGAWGWSVGARVAFLAGLPDEIHAIVLEAPTARHEAPTLHDWYWLFRAHGNGKLAASAKALQATGGFEVRLRPKDEVK